MKKTTEAQLQKKEDQLKETQRVIAQQQKAVEAACSAPSSDTSTVADYQVCSLTQLYLVGFSKSRINVKKWAFSKCTTKVCVSCCWRCPGTAAPSAAHLTVSLYLCSSGSNARGAATHETWQLPGLLTNSIIFGGLFTTKVTTVKARISYYVLVGATPESVLVSLSGSNAKGEV